MFPLRTEYRHPQTYTLTHLIIDISTEGCSSGTALPLVEVADALPLEHDLFAEKFEFGEGWADA